MRDVKYLLKTKYLKTCLWLFVCLFCASVNGFGQKKDNPENYNPPEEGVSLALAKSRAAQISDVRYRIRLALKPKAEKIKGSEEIVFVLKIVPPELVLDFRDLDANGKIINGKVSNVAVNGIAADDFRQINGHLLIAGKRFKVGENKITLDFESAIAAQNRPLVRYLDASDESEYVYSLLTPMDASLAFVCFDQPDLKARFTLETKAPENWTVISNAPVAAAAPDAETGYRRTTFQETLPISTYLFAFAAGNFREIKNENSIVPSSLFVRRSQYETTQKTANELFRVTDDGMRWMIDYFDQKFPFPKYDYVLLPGFAFRAMEHAGATFFREDALLFSRQPTEIDRLNRSVLILHELSHQWFGNLVTMRWFDDLWLKEGFANYIAFAALASASERPEFVWKRFYQNFKPDALEVDITRGTTPLSQTIRNLKDAKSAYGAIVYTKAPVVLRNLEFVVGEKDFRGGVRLFLQRHAFANADWTDLIRAFEEFSGESLQRWANDYIVRRGASFIETEWKCSRAGKIANLTVAQRGALSATEGPRTIKARILLAYDDAPPQAVTYNLTVRRKAIREAVGQKCPAYVFANYEDYGYGYFLLDARSRNAIEIRAGKTADPFLRAQLWGALWESVRAAEMPPLDFVQNALQSLPDERDEDLARNQLNRIVRAYQRYLTKQQQQRVLPALENLCLRQIRREEIQIGTRINFLRTLFSIAKTPAARNFLKTLLSGELKIPGIELRAADRWRIVANLLANGDEQAQMLFNQEKSRPGDDTRRQSYIVGAARADAETKRRYFADYLHKTDVPEDWTQESLANFNAWNHSTLTMHFLNPALTELPKIKQSRKIFFVLAWIKAFIGGQQSSEALAIVRQFLHSALLDKNLRLKILEVSDDLERAVHLRRKFNI